MRRESWRHVVVFALVSAACTNGAADGTTTTEQATASSAIESTTTNAPPTTTTTSTTGETTTTTTASAGPIQSVGSPEALAELVDQGLAFSKLAYGVDLDRSIVPDLTALSVVPATRAIFEFEAQISTLAPAARWVDVFALPGSPAYSEYLQSFTALEENGLRAEIAGDGYSIDEVRLETKGQLSSPTQEALGDAPDGSHALRITTSSGPIRFVNSLGEVSSSNEGWSSRSRLVIVAPSESGWKLFWTERV